MAPWRALVQEFGAGLLCSRCRPGNSCRNGALARVAAGVRRRAPLFAVPPRQLLQKWRPGARCCRSSAPASLLRGAAQATPAEMAPWRALLQEFAAAAVG